MVHSSLASANGAYGIDKLPALTSLNVISFILNPSADTIGDFDAAVGDLVRALATETVAGGAQRARRPTPATLLGLVKSQ